MSYRKFKADKIFDGHKFLPETNILITDDNGSVLDIVNEEDAGAGIEYLQGIISPGFINCHCHLELSHLKGQITKGEGLVNFVTNVMKIRAADDGKIRAAIADAEKEMLQNGIVAVGDICNTPAGIYQKSKRNLQYYNFIEATGFIETNADERFASVKDLATQFDFSENVAVVPHAPYSVSSSLLDLILKNASGKTISIHSQESEAEQQFFGTGDGDFIGLYKNLGLDISFFQHPGTSSLKYLLSRFKHNGPLILVHNVTTSKEDIQFANHLADESGMDIFWCFCPKANLFISNKLPAIGLFPHQQENIVLGTDSLASNDSLNLLEEIVTISNHFPEIKTETMLQWATYNGAKALQLDDVFGRFEKERTPGVILIEQLVGGKIGDGSRVRRIL